MCRLNQEVGEVGAPAILRSRAEGSGAGPGVQSSQGWIFLCESHRLSGLGETVKHVPRRCEMHCSSQ